MSWSKRFKMIATALLVALLAGVVAPVSAQKGGGPGVSKAEVDKLRAEVERLRADLDAALKEINALKGGAKFVPEKGPFYRGRPAGYWLEQLKDFDAKTRLDAVEALAALVQKDKKLIPPLVDSANNDTDVKVRIETIRALGPAGPDALPALIEMVKARKPSYQHAIGAIGIMEAKAKPAVPELIKVLKEEKGITVLQFALPALGRIGPDAKEAIPAVVNVLGDCIKEADSKPPKGDNKAGKGGFGGQPRDLRFGVVQGYLNVTAWDVLKKLDPDLEDALPAPPMAADRPGLMIRDATKEMRDDWRKTHEALVKRYLKPK